MQSGLPGGRPSAAGANAGKENLATTRHRVVNKRSLDRIKQRLLNKEHVSSVKTCVLLDKPGHRLARLEKTSLVDSAGFQIPEIFAAGFGLEYIEHYRELPFIVAIQNRFIE